MLNREEVNRAIILLDSRTIFFCAISFCTQTSRSVSLQSQSVDTTDATAIAHTKRREITAANLLRAEQRVE